MACACEILPPSYHIARASRAALAHKMLVLVMHGEQDELAAAALLIPDRRAQYLRDLWRMGHRTG